MSAGSRGRPRPPAHHDDLRLCRFSGPAWHWEISSHGRTRPDPRLRAPLQRRHDGVRSPDQFLRNVCAQLSCAISALPYGELPGPVVATRASLTTCCATRSGSPGPEDLPVVLVSGRARRGRDAGRGGLRAGVNRLKLPRSCLTVSWWSPASAPASGLRTVQRRAKRSNYAGTTRATWPTCGLHRTVPGPAGRDGATPARGGGSTPAEFAESCGAGKGNFMYLVHLLEGIAKGTVTTDLRRPGGASAGLMDYYKRHWRAMRDPDTKPFERIQRPVVSMLAVSPGAVTAAKISSGSRSCDFARSRSARLGR